MRISRCEWDTVNIGHIADHDVEPDEAEEVLVTSSCIRKAREGRYQAYGTTEFGRYLWVLFEHKGQGLARVITAREMSKKERRLYKKWRSRR